MRLTPSGTAYWVAGGSFESPKHSALLESQFDETTGVAVDRRGDVFVVNPISFGVAEIKANGTLIGFGRGFGVGVPDQAAITNGPDGDVLVAGLDGLFTISPTGAVTKLAAKLRLDDSSMGFVPAGVAASASGTIYVDTDPSGQWTDESAIVSVSYTKDVKMLWASRRKTGGTRGSNGHNGH